MPTLHRRFAARSLRRLGSCLAALLVTQGIQAQDAPPQDAAAQGDGRAVFVRTQATAEAGGLQRGLAQRDWVYVADTLRTSPKGSARFVMRDHTLLAMKPASTVVLSEYQFKAEDTTASKMVTKVTSGGLRALTGLVDKRDPDKVVLQTPLATAGVRGTAIRVDLYPSGIEEIIFDFGHGWVGNKAGRVNVEQGWGARVISATLLPELFKVNEDPEEPAWIVLDLLDRKPPDIAMSPLIPGDRDGRSKALRDVSDKAARTWGSLRAGDGVVLLGLLEQVPNPDRQRTFAILEGFLLASKDDDESLIATEVHLDPKRAPQVLQIAVNSGMKVEPALRTVLAALLPIWREPLPAVMKMAEALGLDGAAAEKVLESVDQPVPCRRAAPGAGESASATREDGRMACSPAESPPLAALSSIVLRYSAEAA